MDLSTITIVIPAHNRPVKLRRLLHYFSVSPLKLIVTDSSAAWFPYLHEFPDLEYYHFPNEEFLLKVHHILPNLKTKYVVYCADDDFIVPEALGPISTFLDENPEYHSAQGHTLSYRLKNKKIDFFPGYIRNFDKDINQNLALLRIAEFRDLYASLLYSVIRTSTFIQMYQNCVTDGKLKFRNLFLAEIYFNLYALMEGKNKTIPIFYSVREKDYKSATYSTVPLSDMQALPEYRNEYLNFFNLLVNQLAHKQDISIENANDVITGILSQPKNDYIHPMKRNLLKLIESIVPKNWMLLFTGWRMKVKGLRITKNMPSYPCKSSTPEKQRIVEAILKFQEL